jgi:hypothetical protein
MEILLNRNELLDLGSRLRGCSIICLAGICWLTQAGDNRDHVLYAGERFNARMDGRLIVTATESCRLQLITQPATVKSGSLWQQMTCSN